MTTLLELLGWTGLLFGLTLLAALVILKLYDLFTQEDK